MITLVVAESDEIVRRGLVSLLGAFDDLAVIGQAADGNEAVTLTGRLRPDLVLLSVHLPVVDGITAAARLSPYVRVAMLADDDDDATVVAALRAGAESYLVHGRYTAGELAQSLRAVAAGQPVLSGVVARSVLRLLRRGEGSDTDPLGLTTREHQVLRLLAQGRSNAEIASGLAVSQHTVKNHLYRIYAKLGVGSRSQAVARWQAVAGVDEHTLRAG